MAHDIRSIGRSLLLATDVLAALTAAGFTAVFYVRPALFGEYDESAGEVLVQVRDRTVLDLVFLGALLLLVVNLLYFLYGRGAKAPLYHVRSEGPGGVVKVSREALESGLRHAGESLDVVSRLRVTVEHGGLKRIVVRAHFQSPEGVSILEASRRLRSALAARFEEMVHLTDGVKAEFDIEFVGFSGKLARRPEPVEDEPPPFTGPKYPIPDDDPLRGRAR